MWNFTTNMLGILTLSMLGKKSVEDNIFLIFPENRVWQSMQIQNFCIKCWTLFSGIKTNLLSAEFAHVGG